MVLKFELQAIFSKRRLLFRSRPVTSFINLFHRGQANFELCIGLMTIPAHHTFLMEMEKGQIRISKRPSRGLKVLVWGSGSIAMVARAAKMGGHQSSLLSKTCCELFPDTELLTSNPATIILAT